MSVLSDLNVAKYAEYLNALTSKRRRMAELSENDLVRINTQMVQWLLGVISGNQTIMTDAILELESIYDSDITPPTNVIGSTPTEANTRRAKGYDVSKGDNTVSFASPMDSTDYTLVVMCYNSAGDQVGFRLDPTLRTVNGFTIYSVAAAKIDYIAILN